MASIPKHVILTMEKLRRSHGRRVDLAHLLSRIRCIRPGMTSLAGQNMGISERLCGRLRLVARFFRDRPNECSDQRCEFRQQRRAEFYSASSRRQGKKPVTSWRDLSIWLRPKRDITQSQSVCWRTRLGFPHVRCGFPRNGTRL